MILYFSREEPFRGFPIYYFDRESIYVTRFDPLLQTKFIIHGFQSSCKDEVFTLIRDGTNYNYYLSIYTIA